MQSTTTTREQLADQAVAAEAPRLRQAPSVDGYSWLARLSPRVWPATVQAAVPPSVFALMLYLRTLMPGLGLWDTAEFQAIGPVLGIAHPTGYPTYTLVAWLASVVLQPLGDEALRANLLSALLVAGAVALAAASVVLLTRRVIAGIAAGLALAVADQPWRVALSADPHALHLFFVGLLLVLLVSWMLRLRSGAKSDLWLFSAAVVYGLALGNHALTILLAPGIALFVFGVSPGLLRRPKMIVACAAGVILTTVNVYAYLPLRAAMDPPLNYANPSNWENFSYLVFGEQFRGTFNQLPPDAIDRIMESVVTAGVLALLAPIGAILLLLRWPALLTMLVAWFGVTWYFSLTYVNAAIGRYYMGPLLVLVVLGGLGAAGLIDLARRADLVGRLRAAGASLARSVPEIGRTVLWQSSHRIGSNAVRRFGEPAVNRALVGGLAALILIVPVLSTVPSTFPHVDQSNNRDGRRWVESVLPRLEQDAVVVSWWSFSTALWYAQFVEGRRDDIYVVDDRTLIDENYGTAEDAINLFLGQRPVYLIRLDGDLPYYQERFQLEPVEGVLPMWGGALYRVVGRAESG